MRTPAKKNQAVDWTESEQVGLFWKLCSTKSSLQVDLGGGMKEGRDQVRYLSMGKGFQAKEKAGSSVLCVYLFERCSNDKERL